MFLDTLKENLLKGARIVLPKELEYKFGITEKPAMTFEIGEGMTDAETERAYDYIRSIEAPTTYTKVPFVQKEFTLGEGGVEKTLKSYVGMPEKIYTSLKELPKIIETGKVPEYKARLYRIPSYAEDYLTLSEAFEKADVPYPRLAAGLLTGGSAIIDVAIIGSLIDAGAKAILSRQAVSAAEVNAARQSMGLPKNWTAKQRVKEFYRLAHITHPDKITGSHKAFCRLNNANQILSKAETTPLIMREFQSLAETLEKPITELGKPAVPYLGVRGLLPERAGMLPTEPYQPYTFKPAGLAIKPSPMKPVPEAGVPKEITPITPKIQKEIISLESQLKKSYFINKPQVEDELGKVWTELEMSEKGERFMTPEGTFVGKTSSFPQWIPEHLRSKELFDKIATGLWDVEHIKYPPANKTKQRELYDLILGEVEDRVGIDASSIRSQILKTYDKITEAKITEGIGRGITGRIRPEEISIRPRTRPRKIGDITPNLQNIEATDDIKQIIKDTAKNYRGEIIEARRGTITHIQTQEIADSLGLNISQLLKRRKGQALNAESLTAVRDLMITSAEEVFRLSKVARKTNSDEALVEFKKALERHKAIQAEVSGATTEAGRALSALKIKAKPGEITALFYKKTLEVLGGRDLTQEIAAKIAKTPTDDFVAMNKTLQQISKATKMDMVFEYWVNSILSSPTTHLVNTTSNFLVRLSAIPLKGAAVALDFMRATITGTPRERFLGEIAADIYGMTKGFVEGGRRALKIWTTGLPPDAITKLEIAQRAAIPGIPGEVVRIPGKALVAEDEFFKALNSQAFLHSEAYRIAAKQGLKGQAKVKRMVELINDPAPEMLSAARAEELYRTFQKDVGKIGQAMMKLRRATPGLKYIIPFLRTPVNIAKFGLEMTPLNFLRLGVERARGAYKGVNFTDELAKPVMGAVISAIIAYYYAQDRVVGHAPLDKEERDTFYREGKLPYSVKIGDTWYSYQRLEPIGTVIGMTADLCQDYDKMTGEEPDKAIRSIWASITQNLINKTYMSGLSNMFNAINDPVRYGGDWLEMFTAGFIPQVMMTPTTMLDPYYRRAEGVVDAWKKKIPGLSEEVPPVRNVWGTKAKKEGGIFWRAISPVKKALAKADPVDQELKKLDYQMGFSSKTITGNFKLDAQHYDIYQRATGRKIHEVLGAIIKSSGYKALPDEDKNKAVQTIVDNVRKRFREEMTFTLFVEQMDIDIPPTVSQQTAAQVYYDLAKETKFKEASNDRKREFYIRNLHKFITY